MGIDQSTAQHLRNPNVNLTVTGAANQTITDDGAVFLLERRQSAC